MATDVGSRFEGASRPSPRCRPLEPIIFHRDNDRPFTLDHSVVLVSALFYSVGTASGDTIPRPGRARCATLCSARGGMRIRTRHRVVIQCRHLDVRTNPSGTASGVAAWQAAPVRSRGVFVSKVKVLARSESHGSVINRNCVPQREVESNRR